MVEIRIGKLEGDEADANQKPTIPSENVVAMMPVAHHLVKITGDLSSADSPATCAKLIRRSSSTVLQPAARRTRPTYGAWNMSSLAKATVGGNAREGEQGPRRLFRMRISLLVSPRGIKTDPKDKRFSAHLPPSRAQAAGMARLPAQIAEDRGQFNLDPGQGRHTGRS